MGVVKRTVQLPDWLEVFTAEERPDLWKQAEDDQLFDRVWPEYNLHGNNCKYLDVLVPRFGDLQALFRDQRSDRLVARALTIPFRWDGSLEDLPSGRDDVGRRALDDTRAPNALSALAAEVDPEYQGAHLGGLLVTTMADMARAAGLAPLVAPVRPTLKHRYPLVPIERYAVWTRDDGQPFDPWLRVHHRLGARMLRPEPRSLQIRASVQDWQRWTGMEFPEDGEYVFPGGLAPLTVYGDVGEYYEPNVWMLHEVK